MKHWEAHTIALMVLIDELDVAIGHDADYLRTCVLTRPGFGQAADEHPLARLVETEDDLSKVVAELGIIRHRLLAARDKVMAAGRVRPGDGVDTARLSLLREAARSEEAQS